MLVLQLVVILWLLLLQEFVVARLLNILIHGEFDVSKHWENMHKAEFDGKNLLNLHDYTRLKEKLAAYRKRGFGTADDWEFIPQLLAGYEYALLRPPTNVGDKLTFGDLKHGDKFIFFPMDGDNAGHGGYKTTHVVWMKIADVKDGFGTLNNAVDDRGVISHMQDDTYVIRVVWH